MRAAIVLQPLLGITNSLQMVATPDSTNIVYFATWSVVTTFLVSFQGFFASLFYCFLNGEVSIYTYLIEFLRGQPIKLIQVVSTSKFHDYLWKDLVFSEALQECEEMILTTRSFHQYS